MNCTTTVVGCAGCGTKQQRNSVTALILLHFNASVSLATCTNRISFGSLTATDKQSDIITLPF